MSAKTMRTLCMSIGLAGLLVACGSSAPEGEADEAAGTTGAEETVAADDTATEAPPPSEEPEEEEAAAGPDDGSQCLPVASCRSFANQTCARVMPDGAIQDDQGEAIEGARVHEACPGGDGVDQSVTECFSYVDRGADCGRSRPPVRRPEWPCGWTEDRCALQTF